MRTWKVTVSAGESDVPSIGIYNQSFIVVAESFENAVTAMRAYKDSDPGWYLDEIISVKLIQSAVIGADGSVFKGAA